MPCHRSFVRSLARIAEIARWFTLIGIRLSRADRKIELDLTSPPPPPTHRLIEPFLTDRFNPSEPPTSSSKMTKMMMMAGSRFRVPRRRNNQSRSNRDIVDGEVLVDDEDTTTTCNDNELVSTATVTFALSSVYYVECEEGT
ncbi:hypothetical protein RP20_CCG026637 [Aedes albopictus]|nr:hypothetical protein RP20_CCG026637 [Aedes albopictus]